MSYGSTKHGTCCPDVQAGEGELALRRRGDRRDSTAAMGITGQDGLFEGSK